MKKTVLLTSATILLGVGFQAINASAAETFPKEYNTEGTITFEAGDNESHRLLIQKIPILLIQ